MAAYHDMEWGVPVRDARLLFEHLSLDIFQSGLSWRVVLAKREGFREAFEGFEPRRVAEYDEAEVARLLGNEAIVRNRSKILATINNARAFCGIADSGEDFASFLWSYAPVRRGARLARWEDVPSSSAESAAMAKALKARGFTFVGPTVCYAFMQAVGIVDDHLAWCFRAQTHLRI